MKPSRDISGLLEIMQAPLRAPDPSLLMLLELARAEVMRFEEVRKSEN